MASLTFNKKNGHTSVVATPQSNGVHGVTDSEDLELSAPPDNNAAGFTNPDQNIFERITGAPSQELEGQFWAKYLTTTNDLLTKTDVTDKAIPILARLITLSLKYKAPGRPSVMLNYLETYLKLRISRNRKSREEFVTMAIRAKGHSEDGWMGE